VRLFLGDANLFESLKNCIAFLFEFSSQIVDANFAHSFLLRHRVRPALMSPARLAVHVSLIRSGVVSRLLSLEDWVLMNSPPQPRQRNSVGRPWVLATIRPVVNSFVRVLLGLVHQGVDGVVVQLDGFFASIGV